MTKRKKEKKPVEQERQKATEQEATANEEKKVIQFPAQPLGTTGSQEMDDAIKAFLQAKEEGKSEVELFLFNQWRDAAGSFVQASQELTRMRAAIMRLEQMVNEERAKVFKVEEMIATWIAKNKKEEKKDGR